MALSSVSSEARRLAALHELAILDTPPEAIYDDVVALAAAICGTPIAVINFVDDHRQWGKALVGLESSEAPREHSFCARTIEEEGGVLVVADALEDPVFATNPMVLDVPKLRFYAGASIVSRDGHAMGSVCVADDTPRELDDAKLGALRALARQTAAHLELRKQSIALAAANRELYRLAIHDALTGLANRTLLHDRLDHALAQLRRYGGHLGVLFCDVDRFKTINDTLGHRAGDELLEAVAARLATTARAVDTVARVGGDEFVIVCPGLSEPDNLELIAARLAEAVEQPLVLAGIEVVPRLSVGGALATAADSADMALTRADASMYRTKHVRAARSDDLV